jgi:hypothetical protein
MKLKALLANPTTLYVVLALSLASLFGYIVNKRTNALLFFALVGYLTTFFTKNMAIVLLVPLLLTNFMFSSYMMREGLEGQKKAEGEGENGAEGAEAKDPTLEEETEEPSTMDKTNKVAEKPTTGNFKPNAELDTKKKKDMTYSQFENKLDNKTIDKLNNDMDGMVNKHAELEGMIEKLSPLIDKAGGLLEKLNGGSMGNLGGMVDKMSGMIGGISSVV